MKRSILIVVISMLLALTLTLGCSAAIVSPVEVGKTVVDYGDWILEKINSDTQWELDEYKGIDETVITPRIIDDMLVVSFGDHCFANNAVIKSVVTSSPLRVIGNYAFIGCSTLERFECNYALHTVGVGAFSGTTSLTNINLEESVIKAISSFAFADSGLIDVTLPSTCTSIGAYSFVRCKDLAKIVIPASVTEIADTAFDGCDNVVIYANGGSYAIEYAIANGIDYVLTDAPVEVTYMVGDADGDGAVSILDATKIQRVLADLDDDPDGMIARRADSDGDGLNILDATRIQRYLADFEVSEPIGETMTTIISAD